MALHRTRALFQLSTLATLFIGVGGCSGDGSTGPPASDPALQNPVRLALATQPAGGEVGLQLRTQPVITVRDATGNLAASAQVTVTVRIEGDGELSGTTAVSSQEGTATFSDIALVGSAGTRTLSFHANGLESVTSQPFMLAPGPASRLQLANGPLPDAQTMVPLNPQPRLQALDRGGNPTAFSGVVSASVAAGPAIVGTGMSVTTDASGVATFAELALGAVQGEVGDARLLFSAQGLDPDSASVRLRCVERSLTNSNPFLGAFSTGDCIFLSGAFMQRFAVEGTQNVNAWNVEADGAMPLALLVRGPHEPQYYWGSSSGTESNRVSYRILMPRGTVRLVPSPQSAGVTGNFSVRRSVAPMDIDCRTILAGSPLHLPEQYLGPGDCESGGFRGDFLTVGLPAGARVIATVTSSHFAPYVSIWQYTPRVQVASAQGANVASAVYRNQQGEGKSFYVYISHQVRNAGGRYELELEIDYPAPSGVSQTVTWMDAPIGLPLHRMEETVGRMLEEIRPRRPDP